MKRLLQTMVLACSLWMVGCQPHRYPEPLLVADSLSMAAPDSAVALLRALAPQMQKASKADRMYYELLRIKAADKAYQPHASDSTILQLVDYYEHGGDQAKLAEAYYYAGRISLDFHDAPQALDYYQRSYELADRSGNKRLKGQLCSQIGYIYQEQYLPEEALLSFKDGYNACFSCQDTLGVIFALRDIADAYKNLNDDKRCLEYLERAFTVACQAHDTLMQGDLHNQFARLYIKQGKYALAKERLQYAKASKSSRMSSGVFTMAAKIFLGLGEKDSAYVYLEWLRENGSLYSKEFACQKMSEIEMEWGQYEASVASLEQYKTFRDSVNQVRAIESVAQAKSVFNYQKHLKENERLRMKNAKATAYTIVAVLLLILLAAIIIIIALWGKRKKLLFIAQLEKERKAHELLERTSSQYIKEKQEEIESLQKMLAQMSTKQQEYSGLELRMQELQNEHTRAELEQKKQAYKSKAIKQTPIYRHIVRIMNNPNIVNKHLSEEDWDALDKTINEIYDCFSQQLFGYCKMSKQEYRICMLVKAGFSLSDTSVLTNRSKQAITSARKRLYFKFFGVKGNPGDIDNFIRAL